MEKENQNQNLMHAEVGHESHQYTDTFAVSSALSKSDCLLDLFYPPSTSLMLVHQCTCIQHTSGPRVNGEKTPPLFLT